MSRPSRAASPPSPRPARVSPWIGVAALCAVFAAKLIVLWQLRDHPLLHPDAGLDTTAYVSLARRVVAGDVALGPGLYYVSPLYIYVLAAGLWIFDSFTAVRVLQVALGTASVAGIFYMGRAWANPRAAWIAAALAATTGVFTFYEVILIQSSIDAFLTTAALTALTLALHPFSSSVFRLPSSVLTGVLLALATLNRPNMLFAAAAVLAVCALQRRWRLAFALSAGLVAGLAPVTARNVIVSGEWSLVSSHGGLNLYIGNNADATGFYREVPGVRPLIEGQVDDTRAVASKALGKHVSDSEASSYFAGLARDWMLAHPLDAAVLFAKKLYFTFHAQHVALPHSYPFFAHETGSLLRFLAIGPWLLVPFGAMGLVVVLRREPKADSRAFLVWLSFMPGYAAGVALFFVAERYRMPLFVPLAVLSGIAVDAGARAVAARRVRALALPALVGVVTAVAVNWPLALNDGRWDDGLRTAQRLVITGHYDEADAWVERLERGAPRPGRAHHGVGMQLVVEEQPARALRHLKRSLELGFLAPDVVEVWLRLGRLSARTDGPRAAEPFFQRAVQIAPEYAAARQQYGLNLVVLDRLADARRELADANRLAPGDADTLAHLAYCELKLGDVEAARAHVREALTADSGHELARQLAAALGLSR